MMRITKLAGDGAIPRLRVEGRITWREADELGTACNGHLGGGRLVLDLSGVQFADRTGVQAIRRIMRRGTTLAGCSSFLRELLKEDGSEEAEASLLRRLRAGDADAFEAMVRTHGPRLLAVARRILGAEADARDALQDGFVSAFRSIGSFEGGSKVSTWLHRIVVNAALMKLRGRRRRPEASIDELLPRFVRDGEEEHHAEPVAEWAEPFEVAVERREVRGCVRACIDRLPETYRTVLVLRDIEELDTEETARLLGVSPNAVKSRLHRARQALRTLLDPHLRGAA
jgi:RNA polymerase sigma-70 factor (ECF subfamily)